MYMATRYIGGKYTPGEVIGDDLTEEQLKWLTQVGAVKEIAPPAGTAPGEAVEPGTEADDEAQMQVGDFSSAFLVGPTGFHQGNHTLRERNNHT